MGRNSVWTSIPSSPLNAEGDPGVTLEGALRSPYSPSPPSASALRPACRDGGSAASSRVWNPSSPPSPSRAPDSSSARRWITSSRTIPTEGGASMPRRTPPPSVPRTTIRTPPSMRMASPARLVSMSICLWPVLPEGNQCRFPPHRRLQQLVGHTRNPAQGTASHRALEESGPLPTRDDPALAKPTNARRLQKGLEHSYRTEGETYGETCLRGQFPGLTVRARACCRSSGAVPRRWCRPSAAPATGRDASPVGNAVARAARPATGRWPHPGRRPGLPTAV